NYLCSRATPFTAVIGGLTPFFASRQVICGSGRVGLGASGDQPGFQLSQRADYIEVEVGLETTLKRGIINTRDEPHADADKYRRLHVIIGDANLAEMSTYLKVGTTALVLDMIESGRRFEHLRLADPVRAVHTISHDPTLKVTVELVNGRKFTGLDLQFAYHEMAGAFVDEHGADREATTVLRVWGEALDALARDPAECADRLDWPAKLRLIEGYRERDGLGWASPRLHMIDLQYSDVRLDKGLYNRLVARGSMRRLISEEEVLEAITTPPEDTRAYFRGRCLERYPNAIAAASWDSVIFDLGRESLVRIPTLEPLRGTKAHVGALLESANTAEELVDALTKG
ncbi:MAG: depupylase/deamidase Dop, partial [Sciscionella sp.]